MKNSSRIITTQHSGPHCVWQNIQLYLISPQGHSTITGVHTDFVKSPIKVFTCLQTERTRNMYFMKKQSEGEPVSCL